MKSIRGKLIALLGSGMVFQLGGCSIEDVLGGALNGVFPGVLSGLIGA